jgi:4-amino-4-deoxy-L-arabinose transferase-like glycosyltransferase
MARRGLPAVRRDLLPLQFVVAILLGLRLYYHLTADVLGDEAYYYLWGQHLSWSYFDHPPLHAILIRIISTLLPGVLGLRTLMWLTLAGMLAIFWSWSKRLAPDDPQRWFWGATAIYLASPLFFGFTLIAYHDHLLILCCLATIHCFALFVESRALRWLYLAAIALGLATLTKYSGVLLGFGFVAAFIVRKDLRPLLLTPHPYLAALLAAAMQAPVIYWNLTEGMASFRFHLDSRWNGEAGEIHWWHPIRFLLLSVGMWSPFLIWPTIRMIRGRIGAGAFESAARTVALATLAVSTVVLLVVAVYLDAFFYWSIVGLVGVTALLASYTRRIALWLHLIFGLVCAALIVVNFAVIPIAAIQGGRDAGSAVNYGWPEIVTHIRAAAAANPTSLIGATGYSSSAQLSFALNDLNAIDFSPFQSQFSYWFDPRSWAGKSGLVLVGENDRPDEIDYISHHFASWTRVDQFDVSRFGRPLYTWRIFKGEGWQP